MNVKIKHFLEETNLLDDIPQQILLYIIKVLEKNTQITSIEIDHKTLKFVIEVKPPMRHAVKFTFIFHVSGCIAYAYENTNGISHGFHTYNIPIFYTPPRVIEEMILEKLR
jgi:hypothetical protein